MTLNPPLRDVLESPPESEGSLVVGYALEVDIARIQPYERNPRHCPNPEYDRIRDSIRNQGLDQPLVITQRPGAADYIVHAGGNTRLMILKALFEATGDTRYARVPCLFRPWRRESDVLLAHLRENDLRGSLAFIDKARAVFETQRLIAQELGLDEITQRRLETELRQAGYRVSQGRISQMEYAVYRLLPLIPLALEKAWADPRWSAYGTWSGLPPPSGASDVRTTQVSSILFLPRCAVAMMDPTGIPTSCARHLENEIAEAAEVSIQTIRVMLDAELAGRELVIPEIEPEPEAELPSVDENARPGVAERGMPSMTSTEETNLRIGLDTGRR